MTSGTIVLSPPSPPAAPHLGTAYTWALTDALHRAAVHLGQESLQPQSWNMSSRRIEAEFGNAPDAFAAYCRTSISRALAAQRQFGVETSNRVALRDDDQQMRAHVQAHLLELVDDGSIRELVSEERWCRACEIALPPTAKTDRCYGCNGELRLEQVKGWFLVLDLPAAMDRAGRIQWTPPYALKRLRSLTDVHPLFRVDHPRRKVGVPSPLVRNSVIDPRLVGAMSPSVLRRMGRTDPLTVVAGLDIQRKWLLMMLAANAEEALPTAVVNHGTLLDESGQKMSRYSGASWADRPEGVDSRIARAALLSTPLGKDTRINDLPIAQASRLHQKFLNCLRFLADHATIVTGTHPRAGVDLDGELEGAFEKVETNLAAHDVVQAIDAYRRLIVHDLSSVLIPRIRKEGTKPPQPAVRRLSSLHQVFYGTDAGLTT